MVTRAEAFRTRGLVIVEHALTRNDLARIVEVAFPSTHPGGGKAFTSDQNDWFARHPVIRDLARELGGGEVEVLRGVADWGNLSAPWFAPWHQDRRATLSDGLGAGLSFLVQIDPCEENDGPIEAIPGSHLSGHLGRDEIAALEADPTVLCLTVPGDILVTHPLLVRRRQRAMKPTSRRTVRLDFAAIRRPDGVEWSSVILATKA